MKRFLKSTAAKLIYAILIGVAVGYGIKELDNGVMNACLQVVMTIQKISKEYIMLLVPFIIFGCVAPSITRFTSNASTLLWYTLGLAYLSSLGAAALAIAVSQVVVPTLQFSGGVMEEIKLPKLIMNMEFPTFSTMSTLILAILIGLGTVWTKFGTMASFLDKFQTMILVIVRRTLIPVLPVFVGSNFAILAFKDQIAQMQIFLPILGFIVACQWFWITLMYVIASIYSRKSGWDVLKQYPRAYLTALLTMSSAATLPVALECVAKCRNIKKDTADFAVPLFSNIHLCGSVVAEIFLVSTVFYFMFESLPPITNLMLFAILACVIAIGSPGVPGGLNLSCMTIVTTMLLPEVSEETVGIFFGIMTAIYTVQDGFGTACNVTTDGALTLMTERKVNDLERSASNSGDVTVAV